MEGSACFLYWCHYLNHCVNHLSPLQRDITKKLGSPKQPSNPFLEMVKFLLERIAPVHIDTESIRYCVCVCVWEISISIQLCNI